MAVITGPGQQGSSSGYNNKVPSGYKAGHIQNFTPEMMDLFKQMMGQLGPDSFLSKLAAGDEGAFNKMEAPALRQFNEVLGGIGSRFSGMGMGAKNSSGFQNATTAAGSNFAQELQANRIGLQRQATSDLMGYANQLLGQKPYENFVVKKQQSGWQQFLNSIGAGFGESGGKAVQNFFSGDQPVANPG